MNLLNKLRGLRQKTPIESPLPEGPYKNFKFLLRLEAWDSLPKEQKKALVKWAKANLYKHPHAYLILQRANGYA